MATTFDTISPIDRMNSERRFYERMAIAIMAVIFIGFAPSFYLFQTVSYPRPNPAITATTMTHGLVFTAWLLVFYTQTRLIAANRRDLHRKLGIGGFALAVTMIPVMYVTAINAIPRGLHPPIVDAITWSAVPLLAIPPIALMLFMGWQHRKVAQTHKRFMLLATLMMVEPGIGRWPIFPPTMLFFTISSLLSFAMVIPLLIWDRRTTGGLHWATKMGLAAMLFYYFARYLVWQTAAWHDFVGFLTGT